MTPALFLDRDGVINVDHGYVHRAEETQFVAGIFDLVRAANERQWPVVVVTNQAGIGRGFYTEEIFHSYMKWMSAQFVEQGARLDHVYFCPHHPTYGQGVYGVMCNCRKPAPGMFLQAIAEHGIDPSQSVMVGDSSKDAVAALAAGVGRMFLLGDGLNRREVPVDAVQNIRSLAELKELLSASDLCGFKVHRS